MSTRTVSNRRKARFIFSILLAAASLLCSYLFIHKLKQGAVFACAFLVVGLLPFERIKIPSKLTGIYLAVIFLGSAFAAAFLSQFLLNESLLGLGARRVVLEIMICLALYLFAFILFPRYKGVICVITLLIILLSTVNHYVYEFKGNEFQPSDFFAVKAAWNVVRGYSLSVSATMFYALAACAVFLFAVCLRRSESVISHR